MLLRHATLERFYPKLSASSLSAQLSREDCCKFAPLFSIPSTMLLPQPFSFQTFAFLPRGGTGPRSVLFKSYLNSLTHRPSTISLFCTLPLLCFQRFTAIKFSKSRVLITIQNGGGVGRGSFTDCGGAPAGTASRGFRAVQSSVAQEWRGKH